MIAQQMSGINRQAREALDGCMSSIVSEECNCTVEVVSVGRKDFNSQSPRSCSVNGHESLYASCKWLLFILRLLYLFHFFRQPAFPPLLGGLRARLCIQYIIPPSEAA